ncbi:MAG: N-acetylornithine carbamoyltransferase [Planctomycetota bacterium]
MEPAPRHLLSASDLDRRALEDLLDLAQRLKGKRQAALLAGKTLGMLFFDKSLRTRVSFEVAAVQLGAHCIDISTNEMYDLEPSEQVIMDGAAEEHVKDAARTLSRYVDLLGVRQLSRTSSWDVDRQERLLHGYAEHATIPVVNLESAMEHPCQAIADVMTMKERLTRLEGRKLTIAWSMNPEAKNIGPCHSLLRSAAALGMDITVAHPMGFNLDEQCVTDAESAAKDAGGRVEVVHDLQEGVRGAEVVYTRAWGSTRYWDDPERETMVKRSLHGWTFDKAVMDDTNNAMFMHPLPVRRGVGATDEVLDAPSSVIYEQAENRVHAQKALLSQLIG